MENLFEQFLKHKEFLDNHTPKTIQWYKSSFIAYKRFAPHTNIPTKQDLQEWVINMRSKIKPISCNVYIKGINSFLKWLKENDYLSEFYKIPTLKTEQPVISTYDLKNLERVYQYKPKEYTQQRLHCLLCLLMDVGLRINEGLTLTRDKVNLDSLCVTVMGKGKKERTLPISIEMRKVLFRFMGTHTHNLIFCTAEGRELFANNVWRDAQRLLKRLGIPPQKRLLHAYRHTFARNYLKNGGNVMYLQVLLGHARLETTRMYVNPDLEDLQEAHVKAGILSKLKK